MARTWRCKGRTNAYPVIRNLNNPVENEFNCCWWTPPKNPDDLCLAFLQQEPQCQLRRPHSVPPTFPKSPCHSIHPDGACRSIHSCDQVVCTTTTRGIQVGEYGGPPDVNTILVSSQSSIQLRFANGQVNYENRNRLFYTSSDNLIRDGEGKVRSNSASPLLSGKRRIPGGTLVKGGNRPWDGTNNETRPIKTVDEGIPLEPEESFPFIVSVTSKVLIAIRDDESKPEIPLKVLLKPNQKPVGQSEEEIQVGLKSLFEIRPGGAQLPIGSIGVQQIDNNPIQSPSVDPQQQQQQQQQPTNILIPLPATSSESQKSKVPAILAAEVPEASLIPAPPKVTPVVVTPPAKRQNFVSSSIGFGNTPGGVPEKTGTVRFRGLNEVDETYQQKSTGVKENLGSEGGKLSFIPKGPRLEAFHAQLKNIQCDLDFFLSVMKTLPPPDPVTFRSSLVSQKLCDGTLDPDKSRIHQFLSVFPNTASKSERFCKHLNEQQRLARGKSRPKSHKKCLKSKATNPVQPIASFFPPMSTRITFDQNRQMMSGTSSVSDQQGRNPCQGATQFSIGQSSWSPQHCKVLPYQDLHKNSFKWGGTNTCQREPLCVPYQRLISCQRSKPRIRMRVCKKDAATQIKEVQMIEQAKLLEKAVKDADAERKRQKCPEIPVDCPKDYKIRKFKMEDHCPVR